MGKEEIKHIDSSPERRRRERPSVSSSHNEFGDLITNLHFGDATATKVIVIVHLTRYQHDNSNYLKEQREEG